VDVLAFDIVKSKPDTGNIPPTLILTSAVDALYALAGTSKSVVDRAVSVSLTSSRYPLKGLVVLVPSCTAPINTVEL